MTRTTRLNLIYARAANGVIGRDNTIPWRLPEDLAHLRAMTMGHPVIMGRRTWDSLPVKFRPLPGRTNIVITRQPDWRADGAVRAASLEEAVQLAGAVDMAWVIGGAAIYEAALPLAHEVHVTEIDADYEGDTFAPALGSEWVEARREAHVSAAGVRFAFVVYRRGDAGGTRP